MIAGGRGRDLLDTDARAGVVRSRDGENDSISCRTRRVRALADGYDEVFPRCALRRGGRVGLLVHTVFTFFEVRDQFVIRGRPPLLSLRIGVTCPADARPGACAGRARLLGGDGRTLGETAFDVRTRERGDVLELSIGEADRERIRTAGEERATLLLDMPGVAQRRYPLTLIAP